jgi:hypothetical protein
VLLDLNKPLYKGLVAKSKLMAGTNVALPSPDAPEKPLEAQPGAAAAAEEGTAPGVVAEDEDEVCRGAWPRVTYDRF